MQMKLTQKITMIFLAAAMVFPLANPVMGQENDKTEALMQEMMAASGAAGAMKRRLTGQNPEARKRFEKIQELRAEIASLNQEVDEILAESHPEYKRALENKNQLVKQYRAARKAADAAEQ